MATYYPDDDLANADWTKQTLDILNEDGKPVKNLKEMSKITGIPKDQLKKLPVSKGKVLTEEEEEERENEDNE